MTREHDTHTLIHACPHPPPTPHTHSPTWVHTDSTRDRRGGRAASAAASAACVRVAQKVASTALSAPHPASPSCDSCPHPLRSSKVSVGEDSASARRPEHTPVGVGGRGEGCVGGGGGVAEVCCVQCTRVLCVPPTHHSPRDSEVMPIGARDAARRSPQSSTFWGQGGGECE